MSWGISLIRCLLCVLVCTFHWLEWSSVSGGTGVSWFVVMSGFLLSVTKKEDDFKIIPFYLSKFARLWPMFFVAFLITSFVGHYAHYSIENLLAVFIASVGGNQFVNHYTGSNAPLWYVKLEIFLVVISPLILLGKRRMWLMLIVVLLISSICIPLKSSQELYLSPLFRMSQFVIGFLGAFGLKRYGIPGPIAKTLFILGIAYLFYQMLYGSFLGAGEAGNPLFMWGDGLIGAMVICSAYVLAKKENEKSYLKIPIRLINWLSGLTFAVFLIHVPVGDLFNMISPYSKESAVYWGCKWPFLIMVSVIIHYVVELPAAYGLKKLFAKLLPLFCKNR